MNTVAVETKHKNKRGTDEMVGFPASFSPIQLHNRLNRPVWLGFKLVRQEDRLLVFLCGGSEGPSLVSKNFATFVGQIVREFRLDPERAEFAELRFAAGEPEWYRWHAQWVGSAPMECCCDPVAGESGRRYLERALNCAAEAA